MIRRLFVIGAFVLPLAAVSALGHAETSKPKVDKNATKVAEPGKGGKSTEPGKSGRPTEGGKGGKSTESGIKGGNGGKKK